MTGEETILGRQSDNHANQLNPNNDAYWQSRGFDGRPAGSPADDDWDDDDWDFYWGPLESPQKQADEPPAKPRERKLQTLLLMGGIASASAAAAMMLPWAKRLKNRLGR